MKKTRFVNDEWGEEEKEVVGQQGFSSFLHLAPFEKIHFNPCDSLDDGITPDLTQRLLMPKIPPQSEHYQIAVYIYIHTRVNTL